MDRELSLAEAEQAYKRFGCSHFFMCREDPDLYEAYRLSKVSREQELRWSEDEFHNVVGQLADEATPDSALWTKHSTATELAESIGTAMILHELYTVSHKILERVPEDESILCAESLLDRRDVAFEQGVIFKAQGLGEEMLATRLLDLARRFAQRYSRRDAKRYAQAIERADTIAAAQSKRSQ